MIGEGVLAHLVGDYLLQSHWMATQQTNRWLPAMVHAAAYTLPFLLLTRSLPALAVICLSHAVIDRYRLARHVGWVENLMGPRSAHRPWADCSATGYPSDTPPWLAVWLMIITDNVLHILINTAALTWLA